MRAYPPPKFRVSSISGSRDSREAEYAPPPPGRVILRPSPGDVLIFGRDLASVLFFSENAIIRSNLPGGLIMRESGGCGGRSGPLVVA